MIIVEGMDNTGKTTLVEKIAKQYPTLQRDGSLGPNTPAELIARVVRMIARADVGEMWLYDRTPLISEEVYGSELRGESALLGVWGYLADQVLLQRPLIIHCDPPEEHVRASFKDRDQMEGVEQRISRLLARYRSVVQRLRDRGSWSYPTMARIVVHDWTQDPACEGALNLVDGTIRRRGAR